MKNPITIILIYMVSFFWGAIGAWFIANYGFKLGLIDRPNERSSHQNETPKGGGIGILVGFIFVSLILQIPAGLWVPAALLSILSLIGDQLHLSPLLRLFFQFSLSIICLLNSPISSFLQMPDYFWIIPLSVFLVGTANFYNFMDGIDGIAGITGMVGFGLLSFYGFYWGIKPPLFVFNVSIAIGCLGFLPFNIPKAKVFMGDVGSILLGFLFAAVVIWMSDTFLDFLCMSSFLFPFYIDELTTMLVRLRDGERLSHPHRRHLYQILANEYEIPHWKISMSYGLFQLVVGSTSLAVKHKGILPVLSFLILYGCIFSAFSLLLRRCSRQKDLNL